MMYGGFDVFKTYLAVKNHFTTDYDFSKYGGRVTASLESFTKRPDRYFFHKLSKRYNERDILDYFVSNFAVDSNKWIGNLINNEGSENYSRFKRYKDAFEYHFRNDCVCVSNVITADNIRFDDVFSVDSGQHPRLLRLLLSEQISIQSVIILDKVLGFVKRWDKEIKETIIWPEKSFKLKKLNPFIKFNLTKCKFIMKEVFV